MHLNTTITEQEWKYLDDILKKLPTKWVSARMANYNRIVAYEDDEDRLKLLKWIDQNNLLVYNENDEQTFWKSIGGEYNVSYLKLDSNLLSIWTTTYKNFIRACDGLIEKQEDLQKILEPYKQMYNDNTGRTLLEL